MDVFGESMSDEWSSALSPRQREVALLVARGLANKEIARELGLSEGTVKQHVHSIFLKLHTRKRNTLVLLANERAIAQSRIPRSLLEFPKALHRSESDKEISKVPRSAKYAEAPCANFGFFSD